MPDIVAALAANGTAKAIRLEKMQLILESRVRRGKSDRDSGNIGNIGNTSTIADRKFRGPVS